MVRRENNIKNFETLYLREIHRSAILELDLILPQYIDNQSLNWSIGIHKYSSWIQTTFMVATNMSHSRHVRRGQRAVGITDINFTVATCVMCAQEQCDDGWEQRKFGDRIQAFWDRFRCYFTAEEQNAVLANRSVTIQLCTSQSFPANHVKECSTVAQYSLGYYSDVYSSACSGKLILYSISLPLQPLHSLNYYEKNSHALPFPC